MGKTRVEYIADTRKWMCEQSDWEEAGRRDGEWRCPRCGASVCRTGAMLCKECRDVTLQEELLRAVSALAEYLKA